MLQCLWVEKGRTLVISLSSAWLGPSRVPDNRQHAEIMKITFFFFFFSLLPLTSVNESAWPHITILLNGERT